MSSDTQRVLEIGRHEVDGRKRLVSLQQRPKGSTVGIPGAPSIFAPIIVTILVLGAGPLFLPGWLPPLLVVALWAVAIRSITKKSFVGFGPAIRNTSSRDRAQLQGRLFFASCVAFVPLAYFAESLIVGPSILAVWAGVTIYFAPARLAALVVGATLLFGGIGAIVAAPAVVLLARRHQRLRFEQPRSVRRTLITIALAFLALLGSLLTRNLTMGRPGETNASPIDPESRSSDFVEWLLRLLGAETTAVDETGREIMQPSGGAQPPEDPATWWLWALLALVALGAAALAYYWWRKRSGEGEGGLPASARPLARLEAIGDSVGRTRERHEGALTYADALADHTGDDRLRGTGPLVSGQVFASRQVDPVAVGHHLDALEATPPTMPRPTLRERLGAAARWPRNHWRGLALTVGSLAAFTVVGLVAIPKLGSFDDVPPERLAFDQQALPVGEDPPGIDELLWPSPHVGRFETCSSTGIRTAGRFVDGRALVTVDFAPGWPATTDRYQYFANGREWSSYLPWEERVWLPNTLPAGQIEPFETVDQVLDAYGVIDSIEIEGIDRWGLPFRRFESMPVDSDTADFSPHVVGRPAFERQWAVDVWVDPDGTPQRVRRLDHGLEVWWEWRRLSVGTDQNVDWPSCPENGGGSSVDWSGWEAWEPIRSVPPAIDFDDFGNPFDADRGYDYETPIPTVSEPMERPISSLTFTAWFELAGDSLYAQASEADTASVAVDWPRGFATTLYRSATWPSALRLDASHVDTAVVRWEMDRTVQVVGDFVAVIADDALDRGEALSFEFLERHVDVLWADTDDVRLDFDLDGVDDTVVSTLGSAHLLFLGYGSDDDLISIVVADGAFPWRLYDFDGALPSELVEREQQLRDCLDGTRATDPTGYCVEDE